MLAGEVFPLIFVYLFLVLIRPTIASDTPESERLNVRPSKPNIILIVADDLGFNDVPWHNKDVIAPNLQKLAKKGIILEQSYVQPICSPTRAALLSGTYPFAIGRQHGVIWPEMPTGLTLNATVIPQLLKPLGYDTHAVGKWHLGFCNWKYTPTERGFDSFKGYYTGSEDYYNHIRKFYSAKGETSFPNQSTNIRRNIPNGYDFRRNKEPYFDAYGNYSTYLFASDVEEILQSSNSSVPKFIYMAFQSVHAPLEVPKKYIKPYAHIKNRSRRTYLGMVTAMDEAIGRIVTALKETNHYNNSVIVFTTDNGGPTISGGNNWPLRGNKTTLWEGGTRGAAFIHSPLIPNSGRTSNNLIHVTDWMATIVSLAGGALPPGTDSIDHWEAIAGNKKSPRKEMIYNINENKAGIQAGIRVGTYKLLVGDPGPGDWTPPPEIRNTYRNESAPYEPHQNEMSTWNFEEHMAFLNKMKRKCRNRKCLNSVFKRYNKMRNTISEKGVWSKLIQTVKKYSRTFQKWWKGVRNSTINENVYGEVSDHKRHGRKNRSTAVSKKTLMDFETVEEMMKLPFRFQLYNVKDDPQERMNLAESKPDIMITLLRRLLTYRDRWVTPDEPANDPKGNSKFWGGVWSPGWC